MACLTRQLERLDTLRNVVIVTILKPHIIFTPSEEFRPNWIAHKRDADGHLTHARHGYHSAYTDAPEKAKWVAFDLGDIRSFNAVVLYPLFPLYEEGHKEQWRASGLYFPRCVCIEIADRSDFSDARSVAEWVDPMERRESDFNAEGEFLGWFHANPQDDPVTIGFPPVSARYVRVVATRLGGYYSANLLSRNEAKRFALALAEVDILSPTGDNLALIAKVSASDQLDGVPRYQPQFVNDGRRTPLPPATLFRREFKLTERPVEAFLEATALGVYAALVNGRAVSEDRFAPEWTQIQRRLLVQRWDITSHLQDGLNVIAAVVGDGWTFGTLSSGIQNGQTEGFYHQFAARITLRYADGHEEILITDNSWRSSTQGPWRQTDLYLGEVFDRRFLADGWDRPGFDDNGWASSATRSLSNERSDFVFQLQDHPGIRIEKEIPCVEVKETQQGVYLLDFGQMVLGVCRIRLRGQAGKPIRLQHVQSLESDGTTPHTFNLCAAMQRDKVIPESSETFVYEPLFTIHSFRYVQIVGAEPLNKEDAVALLIHSEAPLAGIFSSSNPVLDSIVEACDRTISQNLLSVSTDCAARERSGWAVSELGASATLYQRKAGALFRKWLRDFADGFHECDSLTGAGHYSLLAPVPIFTERNENVGISKYFTFGWSDCPLVVTWQHWLHYADREVIEENWPFLQKQTLLLEKIAPQTLSDEPDIFTYFGDWLDAKTLYEPLWTLSGYLPDPARQTDFGVENSTFSYALLARHFDLAGRIAAIFGAENEADRWLERSTFLKTYFTRHFFGENGKANSHSQGAYALALFHDLLPSEMIESALGWLDHTIRLSCHRFSTGFQCTPLLLDVLSRYGRHATACRMVLSERTGGYGHMIANGATSIWERWDTDAWMGKAYMNDFCHRDFTSVADWVWRHVVGIQPVERAPGFEQVHITPKFDGPVRCVQATHHSIRGQISVAWEKKEFEVAVEVNLPEGVKGLLSAGAGKPEPLHSGRSQFLIPLSRSQPTTLVHGTQESSVR